MKAYQIVLLVVAVLSINNLALLFFMGHFSDKNIVASTTHVSALAMSSGSSLATKKEPSFIESNANDLGQEQGQELSQGEITDAIEDYANSEQFSNFLSNWMVRQSQRYQELSTKLGKMTSDELYDFAFAAENIHERTSAILQLSQSGKLKQLSNQQLKSLYTEDDSDQWFIKERILAALVENNDVEAIGWAKQAILENNLEQHSSSDVLMSIYDKDPDFIKQYINNQEFDLTETPYGLLSLIQQEPELSSSFYSQNFDAILASDNDQLFQYGSYGVNIELSAQQESNLVPLFDSSSRSKRSFAIGMVGNIKNTQVLRDSFSKLTRKREQTQFLSSLLYQENNPEIAAVVKELALSSDDPSVRRFAEAKK